jgi:pyrroline-5-carboxylate reductase
MGGAIVSGLLAPHVTVTSITATTATAASARALSAQGVKAVSLEESPGANRDAASDADIIVLGVKPYQILDVLAELAGHANPAATIVSIAAGITLESLEQLWPGAVLRAMPNTPSQVGKGVTGLVRGARVSKEQLEQVRTIFATVGEVLVIDEAHINALSSLSGSGPAYVYFFMERFIEVAKEYGFSPQEALTMVQGTFSGAVNLLEATQKTPGQLREEVTSPKGSTEAALSVFHTADLTQIIRDATEASITRAEEMSKE